MTARKAIIRFLPKIAVIPLITLLIFSSVLHAQDRKADLQQEKKHIEKEIAYTNKLLGQTQKNRRSTMDELVVLKQKIRQRERLINTIKAEVILLNNEINETTDSIFSLKVELKKLKEEYAKMIYYAYRNRSSYDRLVFLFSSRDFNQAYRRLKYFQQYGAYRRMQAELIIKTQANLLEKEQQLELQKADQQSLLVEEQNEKDLLENEKGDTDRTVQNLSQKEKELKASLRVKEKAAAKLQKTIENIIAEEIRLAEERARAEATSKTSSGFALTPEELQLSESFANHKGKLPWPTERGIVSSTAARRFNADATARRRAPRSARWCGSRSAGPRRRRIRPFCRRR